jgi:hypothetical protein
VQSEPNTYTGLCRYRGNFKKRGPSGIRTGGNRCFVRQSVLPRRLPSDLGVL